MSELPSIISATPAGGRKLVITFADGAHGVHDLSWALQRIGPMNEPLLDQAFFERVFVQDGALVWPNGYDLSPFNVRKRMEDAAQVAQQKHNAHSEKTDLARVQSWFEARGVISRRVKAGRTAVRTPDFELRRDDSTIGYCEVKSRQPPDWRAIYQEADHIYEVGAQGSDPAFNAIAKYILTSHDQLSAADPRHETLWVAAIVNHDHRVDVFDLRETLTGDFFAEDGRRYATMKGVSEGTLKSVKFEIDLILWFDGDEVSSILGEAVPERAARTRSAFGLTGPRILWSA